MDIHRPTLTLYRFRYERGNVTTCASVWQSQSIATPCYQPTLLLSMEMVAVVTPHRPHLSSQEIEVDRVHR